MSIMVFAELSRGALTRASRQAISKGREIADIMEEPLAVLLVGHGISAEESERYGPDTVFIADALDLAVYQVEKYAAVSAPILLEQKPGLVLMPNSALCADLAPRLAERLGCGMVSDCVQITIDDKQMSFVKPVYGGKALARIRVLSPMRFVTLRPNAFPIVEKPVRPEIRNIEVKFDLKPKCAVKEVSISDADVPALAEANIIVSGGRGLGDASGFKLLSTLAHLLGAAVGASRSAVDAGWIEQGNQVGQTGTMVSPGVYFAFGISGAIQHIAGMGTSKCIVAVNKDPEANIFRIADYGIVGDLYRVVPAMIDKLQEMTGNGTSSKSPGS